MRLPADETDSEARKLLAEVDRAYETWFNSLTPEEQVLEAAWWLRFLYGDPTAPQPAGILPAP